MKATVKWVEGYQFIGQSGRGPAVIMDGSGGDNPLGPSGASPMEMLLLGLGGCTGIDVVLILQKMRQAVSGCEIEVEGTRADETPRVYTAIHTIFHISGENLAPEKVEQAVALSAEKYCSVSLSLNPEIAMTREIRITDTAAAAALAPEATA